MKSTVLKTGIVSLALSLCMVSTATAQDLLPRDNGIFDYHTPPRYRPSESHPLRTLGYVVHPVGWALREVIYRPWSAFVASSTVTASVFGYREPYDYREALCFGIKDYDCKKVSPYSGLKENRDELVSGDKGSDVAMLVDSGDQVYFPDVAFDFDKASLNELGKARVRQVSQLLANMPSVVVVVEGHTDYKGTDEYNMDLGARRAQSVIQELTELGIDPARLQAISYGESQPVFTEEEDWARAVNRRVQFKLEIPKES